MKTVGKIIIVTFSILDTTLTTWQLKIKEGKHIAWEEPNLKKQVNHVSCTLNVQPYDLFSFP